MTHQRLLKHLRILPLYGQQKRYLQLLRFQKSFKEKLFVFFIHCFSLRMRGPPSIFKELW